MILRFLPGLVLMVLLISPASAHPMPDVMVRSFFNEDGSAAILVELDPRSFAEDPNTEPYIQNWVLGEMTEEERAELIAQAEDYVEKAVEIRFLPMGRVEPEFKWRFTGHDDRSLEKIDDPVILTGEWNTSFSKELEGYQVDALDYRELSVYFLNHMRDQAIERYQVLFPGETSYVLDLKELAAAIPAPPKKTSNAILGLGILAAVIPIVILILILVKRRIAVA